MRPAAVLLITLGVAAIVLGLLFQVGWLSWFGRLPGDIDVERGGMRVFIPITSMILVSLVLTLVLNLLRRLF
ncbi:MAG TPA: DUF2905 domain-containing protein [Thermoanaerobaculia bacterium]|nr:DUF2905 domain-containing protein [Thermoanaerobaculia bacterium]